MLGDRALTNGDDAQPAKPRTVQVAAPATGVTNLEIASQTVPLATSSRMANATGDVALTSAGRGLIVLRAMPAPKPGRSWQAWTVSRDGTRRSARVVDSGGALVVLDIKVPAGTQAIAITDEPAGGSAQPSTAAAAYGSLT